MSAELVEGATPATATPICSSSEPTLEDDWSVQRTIRQHAGPLKSILGIIFAVTFSPDGRRCSCGVNSLIKVWDAATWDLVQTLEGHEGRILCLSYSPDGEQLTSASRDKSIKQWDPVTGLLLRSLKGHEGRIPCIAYSPDGKTLASGSEDKTIRLWHSTSGSPAGILRESGGVLSIAYAPDGKQLASASTDTMIKLWNPADGTMIGKLTGTTPENLSDTLHPGSWQGHVSSVLTIAYSPNGKQLASGSTDGSIKLWDPVNQKLTGTLSGADTFNKEDHSGDIMCVVYSPDGERLASGSGDKTIKLWNPITYKLEKTLSREKTGRSFSPTGRVLSIAYSPDGRQLVSGLWDEKVILWARVTAPDGEVGQDTMFRTFKKLFS